MTGRKKNQQPPPGGWPAMGAWSSKLKGNVNPSIPAHLSLMYRVSHRPWGDPGDGGFLGMGHAPFRLVGGKDTGLKSDSMVLQDVTLERLGDRDALRSSLDKFRRQADKSGAMEGLDEFAHKAMGILTSSRLAEALDLSGVRYTGSGHLSSALAMDKDLSKHLFRAAGVRTADWVMATDWRPAPHADEVERTLGMPVIVKPSKQGSTVGLSLVKEPGQFAAAVAEARKHDYEVMIERFIAGRELTVGILGGIALPVGEIIPKHEIYDYECKYTKGMATEVFPAELSGAATAEVQRQAQLAFGALKLGGCARIDFRMTGAGEFYCLEANTLPGMTELSLIPQAAAAAGIDFPDLCERIARLALNDGEDSQ
jgi:D-alanine--D-alanine ligase